MSVTGHPRNKAPRTLIFMVIILILITSACTTGSSIRPFNSIFGDNIQQPYDQATEEGVLKAYIEEVDLAWVSVQSEIEKEEERTDHLLNTIDAISVSSELLELNDEDLSQLLEDLETTKTKIERIQNQYKLIAPLRSGQDFFDYSEELNQIFLAELDFHNSRIAQLISSEEDISAIEEQMELGLLGLSRNLFAFEKILFSDDVQDFMTPYIEYSEAIVVYIGLLREEIDQEIILVTALIEIKGQAGEQENVDEQAWNNLISEGTNYILLRDHMASETFPEFPSGEGSNFIPRSDSTELTIQSCGTFKVTSPISGRIDQSNFNQPIEITCPILSDFDKKFIDQMNQNWRRHVQEWTEDMIDGLRDIWKDFVKESNESSRPLPLLEDEYNRRRDSFISKMEMDLEQDWQDLQNEISDMYERESEILTKKYSLTITAAHQMSVSGYPDYTIEVSGSEVLNLDPWTGISGLGQFPMEANWPMDYGAYLFGGDTITVLFRGRCADGQYFITIVNEAGGSTAQGTIVHPKGPTPMTVFRWIRPGTAAYEMIYTFSGSGEAPPKTFSASDLYPDLAGTVSWALDINH